MADPKSQLDAQAEGGTVEVSEFASLLNKEFKPKTDEAKEPVEQAVPTLAEQALAADHADRHAMSSSRSRR